MARRIGFARLALSGLLLSGPLMDGGATWATAREPAQDGFVRVRAGEFTQGAGTPGRNQSKREINLDHPYSVGVKQNEAWNEQPAHTVRLTRAFDLAKHEVTVAQFRRFVEATGYVTDAERNGTALGFDGDPPEQRGVPLHFRRFKIDPQFTWRAPASRRPTITRSSA